MAPVQMPMPATRRKISTLLNPILEICHHPDRDRLLAEFFNR